jgi:L-lactate dehydrogenase complex protein LldG
MNNAMNNAMNASMTDVTAYIAGLREKTRGNASPTELPPNPAAQARRISPGTKLLDDFVAAAGKINTRTYVTDAAHWPDVLMDVLEQNAIKSLLLTPLDEKLFTNAQAADLRRRLIERGIEVCEGTDDDTLFRVDAALTGVTAAIAEFGSLVCASSASEARGFSLIPPTHIALVPASRILPDLCDLFDDALAINLPAGMSLITGPSKTADIEGVLVNGVHGPKTVHTLCIRDA